MGAIVQMTDQTLNALKGWPQPAAVDFHAAFDSTVAAILDPVPPGAVVSLNSSGNFILGVGNVNSMPMFTFQGSNDPDVANYGGDPSTQKGAWIPISPTGQVMALVAVGAYELVSTFYVSGSYAINAPLTSATSGANAGKLAVGTIGTNMIVGIVSRGLVDNGYGATALAFWPFPIFHV